MLTKSQKKEFVLSRQAALKKYKTIGIIQLSGIPDRLLQATKSKLKGRAEFILGRKKMLEKILETSADSKKLAAALSGTCAIVLSNEDPFELFKTFKSNKIKLEAKPKQVATTDVFVHAGETSLQPGQAVTEVKQAGIDVQIQKGKVVIGKDKLVVKQNEVIVPALAKALHTLGITPFTAVIEPVEIFSGGLLFKKALLDIDPNKTAEEIAHGFNSAVALCFECGITNSYTIKTLITKAFNNAMAVGVHAGVYDKGITEKLLSNAASHASALNSLTHKK
jgi:large subunit ribosomal protein L10